jgi:uncharacterized phage protein (TIGR01671 family)
MEHRVVAGTLGAFYAEGIDPKDSACISPFNTKYSDQTPIMQFIGQTDQNGVEIYEGDILMVTVDRCRAFMTEPFIVEFLDGAFQLINTMDSSEGYFWIDVVDNSAKVIGNIHENSELLAQ